MKKTKLKRLNPAGFTIIELMIALSVLSVILVMTAIILIQISSLYTKGINQANLQNDTRSVMADVTAGLQFSGQPADCYTVYPSGLPVGTPGFTCYSQSQNLNGATVYSLCIGNIRYSYILDREIGTDPYAPGGAQTTWHSLWRDTLKDTKNCNPLDINQNTNAIADGETLSPGYEMLGQHMRLIRFWVSPVSTTAGVTVYKVDVWTAFGDSDLLSAEDPLHPTTLPTCSSNQGTQFCAVSELSSYVTSRTKKL